MNVRIEKLIYGGEGLGHADGKTVFVPFVLPGEIVSIHPAEQKKKFVRGRLQHLVTPSPERTIAPCAHFTACGGCHYQHLSYPAQLESKSQILRETLSRLGHIPWEGPIHAHPSPPLGYRNRAQWKVRPVGTKSAIGYFQAGSNALCPVEHCPILSPRLEETFSILRGLLAAGKLPPSLREIEAFADAADAAILLNFSQAGADSPNSSRASSLREALPSIQSLLFHDTSRDHFELDGPGYLEYRIGARVYRVGHLSFFQVNRFLAEEVLATVIAGAAGSLAMDLFAGVGFFSLGLAGGFGRVIAVESNPAAARDLSVNAASSGGAVQVVNSEVEEYLARHKDSPDLVLLDPPRAGVPASALKQLLALAPAEIRYLSCDPSTLARDLAALLGGGYAIRETHLFDMFPQTFHIESYVRLTHAGTAP